MNRPINPSSVTRMALTYTQLVVSLTFLSACATTSPVQNYDFGATASNQGAIQGANTLALTGLKWVVADIRVPASLDSNAMLYRLNYENTQELKPYAQSRWSTTPAQLLTLRFKQAINQAGGAALSANDGIKDLPQLRIELDEFSQHFNSPQRSQAHIQLRVGLVFKNNLLAQKSFIGEVEANSADAKGGAIAMSRASDQIVQQVLQWAQQVQKEDQSAKMP